MTQAEHLGFFASIARELGGKGHLRLIVQPIVAIVLGIRLGIADAREGRGPFVIRVFGAWRGALRRALTDIAIPFGIAIVIDAVLQHYTLGYARPLASLLVAFCIVWLPFAAARGFTNRAMRRSRHAETSEAAHGS